MAGQATPTALIPDDAKGVIDPATAPVQLIDLGGEYRVAVQAGKHMLLRPAGDTPQGEVCWQLLDKEQTARARNCPAGLRARSAHVFITTGKTGREQMEEAALTRKTREKAQRKEQKAKDQGKPAPDTEQKSIPYDQATGVACDGDGYIAFGIVTPDGQTMVPLGFVPGKTRTEMAKAARARYADLHKKRPDGWPEPDQLHIVSARPASLRVTQGKPPTAA